MTGVTCNTLVVLAFMANNIVGPAKLQAVIPLQLMFGGLEMVARSLWFRMLYTISLDCMPQSCR